MNIIGDYEAHKRDEEWNRREDRRLEREARKGIVVAMPDGRIEVQCLAWLPEQKP